MGFFDSIMTVMRGDTSPPTPQPEPRADAHGDAAGGFMNMAMGLGVKGVDKSASLEFRSSKNFSADPATCRALYRSSGIMGRVIDIPIDEMLSPSWSVDSPEDGFDSDAVTRQLHRTLRDIPVRVGAIKKRGMMWAMAEAQKQADTYGSAILVLGYDDIGDLSQLSEPLDLDTSTRIDWVHIHQRHSVTRQSVGEASGGETYQIHPVSGAVYTVHESRTLRFDGRVPDDEAQTYNDFWADSLYNIYWPAMSRYIAGQDSIASVLFLMGVTVYKIQGLLGLAQNPTAAAAYSRVMGIRHAARSMHRALLLDSKEDHAFHSPSLSGLKDVTEGQMLRISAVTGIPLTRLFGRAPAGLNATGEAETATYHERLSARRTFQVDPALEHVIGVYLRSPDGPTGGVEPATWSLSWDPFSLQTREELITETSSTMDAAAKGVAAGLITIEEARTGLRGGIFDLSDTLPPVAATTKKDPDDDLDAEPDEGGSAEGGAE